MSDYKPPKPEKNILDHPKFGLSAKPLPGAKRPCTLKIGLYNNNPQVTIWTGLEGPEMRIQAGLDPQSLTLMMDELIDMGSERDPSKQKEKYVRAIDTYDKERNIASKVVVGRQPDGVIYISVIEPSKNTKVIFELGNSYFHHLVEPGSNSPIPNDEISRKWARSWAGTIKGIVPAAQAAAYKHYSPNGGGGGKKSYGNNGGGGNYGNQNNGGGSSDDDLPF